MCEGTTLKLSTPLCLIRSFTIYPHRNIFAIPRCWTEGCLQSSTPPLERFLLLVLVDTKLEDGHLREATRSTWLSSWKSDCVYKFVVATGDASNAQLQQLAIENAQHGDLLFLSQINEDHTSALSEKFLGACAWATSTGVHFSYIFKCEAGKFANLGVIVAELLGGQHRTHEEGLLWGHFASNAIAKDHATWHLCDTYLPYPEGGSYIISRDVVELLVMMADDLERFSRDDIAMGAWLAPFARIRQKHDVRFNTGWV